MKTIEICGKQYEVECNALTYVKYKNFFKTGILKDMQFVENYLIKQTIVSQKLIEKKLTEEEKTSQLSRYMIDETDEFVIKVTQLAWILIYSANNKVEEYDKWLKSIEKFNVSDNWIVEVTELAVDCFC